MQFKCVFYLICRSGSVVAIIKLAFVKSASDPLKPLQDEIKDGHLASFTVEREIDLNPTEVPLLLSTSKFMSIIVVLLNNIKNYCSRL